MNMLASRGQLRASFIRWALFTVPAILLLGFLAGQMGSQNTEWFRMLEKPAIFPEPKWFGIVWSILYVIIGLSVALVAAAWGAKGRGIALAAFAIHFLLNLAWSPIFFAWKNITLALYVITAIDVTLIIVIVLFWRVRKVAAVMLLPYLAWVLFATLLNWQFLELNPGVDGGTGMEAVERVRISR